MEWANQGGGVLDLLGKEGPRGRWRRGTRLGGTWVAPEGLNFFPSRICTCVLLSRISLSLSLSLLGVKVKFGLAPFSFVQYATAFDQGQSAETCYASWNILREKYRKGFLSIKRSERIIKNIMIVLHYAACQWQHAKQTLICIFIPQIQVFLHIGLTPWRVLNTLYTFVEPEETRSSEMNEALSTIILGL